MRRTVALTTAITLPGMFGWIPTSSARTAVAAEDVTAAELLLEEHFDSSGHGGGGDAGDGDGDGGDGSEGDDTGE